MDERHELASDEMLRVISALFEARDHSLSPLQNGSRPLTAVSADKILAYLERRPWKSGWSAGPQGQPVRVGPSTIADSVGPPLPHKTTEALLRSAAPGYFSPEAAVALAAGIDAAAGTESQLVPKPQRVEKEGIFELDGVVYKVVRAIAMGDGHLYAKRFNAETKKFVMAKGMVARLSEANRVTAERAAEFGRLYGTCMDCGRDLTDEESIAAGRGRVCREKLGDSDYYSI
jgi:hypothetical protein